MNNMILWRRAVQIAEDDLANGEITPAQLEQHKEATYRWLVRLQENPPPRSPHYSCY